jgi:hypothetical protein
MCCLDAWINRAPPIGGAGPLQHDEQPPSCCSITRTVLSVAAIALSVFSTAFYVGTGSIVALGCATVLGIIAAIVLSQRPTDGGGYRHVPQMVHLFHQAIPAMPVHPLPPQPVAFFEPQPPVAQYVQPETRVQVRDHSFVGAPPMFQPSAPPMYHPPVVQGAGGEERVRVRDRRPVGPMFPPPMAPTYSAPAPVHPMGEERVQVRSHAPTLAPPVAPPTFHQTTRSPAPVMGGVSGEARIQVRDGGRPGVQPPDDEQRVPVGRGGRR